MLRIIRNWWFDIKYEQVGFVRKINGDEKINLDEGGPSSESSNSICDAEIYPLFGEISSLWRPKWKYYLRTGKKDFSQLCATQVNIIHNDRILYNGEEYKVFLFKESICLSVVQDINIININDHRYKHCGVGKIKKIDKEEFKLNVYQFGGITSFYHHVMYKGVFLPIKGNRIIPGDSIFLEGFDDKFVFEGAEYEIC